MEQISVKIPDAVLNGIEKIFSEKVKEEIKKSKLHAMFLFTKLQEKKNANEKLRPTGQNLAGIAFPIFREVLKYL